jgi:hypothetical protein
MSKFRLAHLGLALAALGFTAAAPVVGLAPAYAAETLRPEVGKPLQEAQQLMKSGKNKEALAKLRRTRQGQRQVVERNLPDRTHPRRRRRASRRLRHRRQVLRIPDRLGQAVGSEKAQFSEGLIGIYMRAGDLGKANAAIEKPAERARRSEAARLPDAELLQARQRRRA